MKSQIRAAAIALALCLAAGLPTAAFARKSTAPIVASLDIASSKTANGQCEAIWGGVPLSTPLSATLLFRAVGDDGSETTATETLYLVEDELTAAAFVFPVVAPGRYTVYAALTMYVEGGQYAREDSVIVRIGKNGSVASEKERVLTAAEALASAAQGQGTLTISVAPAETKVRIGGLESPPSVAPTVGRAGALTVDADKPQPEVTPPFTVSGFVAYVDKTFTSGAFTGTANLGLPAAKIELLDQETGAPELLGVTQLNAGGQFVFTVPNNDDGPGEGGRDLFLRLTLESIPGAWPQIKVADMTGATWVFVSDVKQNHGGGNTNFQWYIDSGALNIYYVIYRTFTQNYRYWGNSYAALDTIYPAVFKSMGLVTARWAPGNTDGTYYNKANSTIYLLGATNDPDEYDDDVIRHELAHFMLHKYSYEKSPGGDHSWDSHISRQLAWAEGWSTFLSCMAKDSQYYVDHTASSFTVYDLELPTGKVRKSDCEGAVAATLWDLWDQNNDNQDTLWVGCIHTFPSTKAPEYFSDAKQCTICDYYASYTKWHPDRAAGFDKMFAEHGLSCAGQQPPTVVTPSDAGILWQRGSSYSITWGDFPAGPVKIELIKGASIVATLSASEPNDGSMPWAIPANQALGADYKIKVTSIADATASDMSDNFFSIVAAPEVLYPSAGGIRWVRGSQYTITWIGFPGAQVNIELWKGGAIERTIAANENNDGSMTWTVPPDQTVGPDFKIKITAVSDAAKTDFSDTFFTIVGPPRVVTPSDAGIIVYPGIVYPITWVDFPVDNVRIELYKGAGLRSLIALSTPNSGSFNWVPPFTESGKDYRIKISSTTDTATFDFSDNYFTIAGFPKVIAPSDPGITLQPGANYQIRWSDFPGANVRIDLYKDWRFRRTLFASTPNDDAENWTVPADEGGAGYRVRIVSTINSSRYDFSDYEFAIASGPRVVYPSIAGIALTPGVLDVIEWADFPGALVKIDLYKAGAFRSTIYASTDNDGQATWIVPFSEAGADYQIRVTALSDPTKTDLSDNTFRIAGVPRVIFPSDAGITLLAGKTYSITWADFPGTQVRIDFYRNFIYKSTITSGTANDGAENWTVPLGESGPGYQIRISSVSDTSKYDFSDNYFNIGP